MIEKVEAYEFEGRLFRSNGEAECEKAATDFAYAIDPFFANEEMNVSVFLDHMRNLREIGRIAHKLDPERLEKLTAAIKACSETK